MLSSDAAKSRQKRPYLIAAMIIGLVFVGGVWVALNVDLDGPTVVTDSSGGLPLITEITLATLAEEGEALKENPALRQKRKYTTNDPLALRITTDPSVTSPLQIGARLISDDGAIVELTPSSLTFQPGTSTFCCWQVTTAGKYTLQLFRPEKVITSIPLTIDQAIGKKSTGKVQFSF